MARHEAATPAEFALGRMAMALAVVDALKIVAEDLRLPVRFRAPRSWGSGSI